MSTKKKTKQETLPKEDVTEELKKEDSNIQEQEEVTLENQENEKKQKTKMKVAVTAQVDVEEKVEKEAKQNKVKLEEIVNEKEIEKVSNVEKVKKSHKTSLILTVTFFTIILLFLLLSTIFAFIVSKQSTIVHGVSINHIDVSGLTKEQALEKVSNALAEKLTQPITLKHNEYELTVFPEQFGVSFAVEESVNIAYDKGRSGNIFQNNYDILASLLFGSQINAGFSYAQDTLDSLMSEMEINLSDRFIESSYYVENNNLILSKGKDGVIINRDKLKTNIIFAINNLNCNIDTITIPTIFQKASTLDLNKIYQEVYRAPQDAYYTTNPYALYPHVDGVDFAISLEEASNLLTNAQQECSIPLKVLSPAVTTNQIGKEAFPDLLGSYSTTFSTANVSRSTNIRLASNKINGIVIMPGETFSYNQTVGQRTAAAGFKSAAVYAGGEVTTGIGGGICQVSSTLYNAVLLANLEIVERQNHGFNTGYVPVGRDATVSWGGPDFKFKNTRNYPIRVVSTVSGGRIITEIFGLKMENEYEVEIQSYVTQYIKYKTIEKKDATLEKGKTKVIQSGSNGCKSVAYRILKQNGEVVSKTLLSQDTYNPHNEIISVGTKEVKKK